MYICLLFLADNRYEIYDGGPKIVAACDNWGTALIFKEDGLYPGEIVYDQLGHFDFQLGRFQRYLVWHYTFHPG